MNLVACATTLDQGQCLSEKWYKFGYADGVKGLRLDKKHNEACQEYGVRVNIDKYSDGWDEGIKYYCTGDKIWYKFGYEDGEKGYNSDRYKKHHKACQKYGVQVNIDKYSDGWEKGIKQYCTEDNGWKEGVAGSRNYHENCPTHLQSEFLHAYQLGIKIYIERQELEDINDKLKSNEDELNKLDRNEGELADDTPTDYRESLLKKVLKKRRYLESCRSSAERGLDRAISDACNYDFGTCY